MCHHTFAFERGASVMGRVRQLALIAFLIASLGPTVSTAQNSEWPSGPRAYSERFYFSEDAKVPMRDGVSLQTRILRPRATVGALPFFLVRTPYGLASEDFERRVARFERLAQSGYIFVIQDMRGTGASGGEFVLTRPRSGDPSVPDETTDAYDTAEWLLSHVKGHNGRIGVAGCSYPGFAAVMAGLAQHPAIKAVSPQAAMADLFRGDDYYWNGIPILAQAPLAIPRLESRLSIMARVDKSDAYEWFLAAGALKDVQPAVFVKESPTWNRMLVNASLTPFWQSRVLATQAAHIKVPTLHVLGWYDGEDFPGPMRLFQAIDATDTARIHRMVVGPWQHCTWTLPGPGDSVGPLTHGVPTADQFKELEARFFAHYLKDEGTLDGFPQVLAFETGGVGWRSFDRWPEGEDDGARRTLFLASNGKLQEVPEPQQGWDEYISDPMKPVPYARRPIGFFTGDDLVPGDGKARSLFLLEDQRFVQDRPDVLTWISQPLSKDLVLSGKAAVTFFAATTGTDVDWIVQLIDVYPDDFHPVLSGYRLPVTRGALRASLRHDLANPKAVFPEKIERYSIELEARLHRFKAGHRIVLQLQSTYFPYLARNPQQFIAPDRATVKDFRVVRNEIHHGKDYSSAITLPVERAPRPCCRLTP